MTQRWIPCSERYPEDGKWALWSAKDGNLFIARYKFDAVPHFFPPVFSSTIKLTTYGIEDAVAWQPLPSPYTEESIE